MRFNIKNLNLFQLSTYNPKILLLIGLGAGVVFAASSAVSADVPSSPKINVWWPKPKVLLSGQQSFKADLTEYKAEDYKLFWSVDDGQWNSMHTDETDYPHKESRVDPTGWQWKGSGPYMLSYRATDMEGRVLAQTSFAISVKHNNDPTKSDLAKSAVSNNRKSTAKSASTAQAAPGPVPVNISPLKGRKLYVSPDSPAARQSAAWRDSRPNDAAAMDRLAAQPAARWFGGWNQNLEGEVRAYTEAARQSSAVPVLVAYNIPQRDCGSYSAGGSSSAEDYLNWVQAMARGIGSTASLVILEPDALGGLDCLSPGDRQIRKKALAYAVTILKQSSATAVYIDAGHPRWHGATEMAGRLQEANIGAADGFSLNVSNFITTDENIRYGTLLSQQLGGKHFVIDTGRNGAGPTPDSQWCNPEGRLIGELPTISTPSSLADAYLWIKTPGESDGNCREGAPAAGVWWPDYALGLFR